MAASRLQRWALVLAGYSYNIFRSILQLVGPILRMCGNDVRAQYLAAAAPLVAQQFDRPHAGDCKIRNQSRIRADNKTCAYGYRDHNKFETSPSNSVPVREFSALLIFN